jgi:hypothetical protein
MQVLVVAGGITVGTRVRGAVKDAQRKQKLLSSELYSGRVPNARKPVGQMYYFRDPGWVTVPSRWMCCAR